jgi:hypothetical protein
MDRTIERVRAVLRFISPDDITPMGVRMIQKVLDEEEERLERTSQGDPGPEQA